jgi:hypothetical protein
MVDFEHESDRGEHPMGFMDKAKKLAEQAQEKLDEVQTQFNETQQGGQPGGGPAPEYDQHGRPVGGAADAVPDQKAPTTAVPDPIEGAAPEVPPAAPTGATPAVAEPTGEAPTSATEPLAPSAQPSPTQEKDGDYSPPGVTHGDPLEG